MIPGENTSLNDLDGEIWTDIPDYLGYYQVSTLGRVKSLPRTSTTKNGVIMPIKLRILKQFYLKNYLVVNLYKNKECNHILVHKIVANTFLKGKTKGHSIVVDHINNVPTDNRPENLQIITARINVSKDRKVGTSKYTGVSWVKSRKKWRSSVIVGKKEIHLGYFDDELEASKYYKNAIKSIEKGTKIVRKVKKNSSKYKGVSFNNRDKRWVVYLPINGKRKYIGKFKTESLAIDKIKKLKVLNQCQS